jgi:hypothetical protein
MPRNRGAGRSCAQNSNARPFGWDPGTVPIGEDQQYSMVRRGDNTVAVMCTMDDSLASDAENKDGIMVTQNARLFSCHLSCVRRVMAIGIMWAGLAVIAAVSAHGQPVAVQPLTLPPAGRDVVRIVMEETYDIQGVGKETVQLSGTLTAERATPLMGFGEREQSWQNSTVVAKFTRLQLEGTSRLFGKVKVSLDPRQPAYGVVTGGHCRAVIGANVTMSKVRTELRTQNPVQLTSDVKTVPPIGDESTVSVGAVNLVDQTGRTRGTLESARVMWRELTQQSQF